MQSLESWLWRLLNFAVNDLAEPFIVIYRLCGVHACVKISRAEGLAERDQIFQECRDSQIRWPDVLDDERFA